MDAMQIPATGENIPTAMATAESDAVTDSPIPVSYTHLQFAELVADALDIVEELRELAG